MLEKEIHQECEVMGMVSQKPSQRSPAFQKKKKKRKKNKREEVFRSFHKHEVI